jgi:CheY-like chemotaxis protein
MTGPIIEHWVVTVARAAGLDGVAELHVDSGAAAADAWNLVGMAAGVTQAELARRVAAHFRLPVADLDHRDPHVEKIIPRRVAMRLQVLPLRYTDRSLVIASADPVGMEAERELTALAGRTISPEVASPDAIRSELARVYPEGEPKAHEIPRLMPDEKAGPRVLVVDDDPDARALLRNALESRGFRVVEASDGTEALEQLAGTSEAVHLVTLDLQMRELHGLETLRRIRGSLKTAHLPVIVATGSDDAEVEMQLFDAGADDYVVKPIDPPRFVLRVQAVLRRRGGVQAPIPL